MNQAEIFVIAHISSIDKFTGGAKKVGDGVEDASKGNKNMLGRWD